VKQNTFIMATLNHALNRPQDLEEVTGLMLLEIEHQMQRYLDGYLELSSTFPEQMKTLEDEILSEWSSQELNHYSEFEDYWRDRIDSLENYPKEVQPEIKLLGRKQYDRALAFFHTVMVDSLPDQSRLKKFIYNTTGYLTDGLHSENWEKAMVDVVRTCLKKILHPGINYLIKHIGCIFRNLFATVMNEMQHANRFSDAFRVLHRTVEGYLSQHFDDLLWELMKNAAEKTHSSLEPMYTTINPNIVNERGPMVAKDEAQKILNRAYEYMSILMDFILVNLRFQLDHHLFLELKRIMNGNFADSFMKTAGWEHIVRK
jgi:hypothetical protein